MRDKVKEIKQFIEHNIKLGYLTKENTIEDLQELLENIEDNYIQMIEKLQTIDYDKD